LNARTTKDRILSPAPLAKLGYPCIGVRIYWLLVRTFPLRYGSLAPASSFNQFFFLLAVGADSRSNEARYSCMDLSEDSLLLG
jgi:hypothetical protein